MLKSPAISYPHSCPWGYYFTSPSLKGVRILIIFKTLFFSLIYLTLDNHPAKKLLSEWRYDVHADLGKALGLTLGKAKIHRH